MFQKRFIISLTVFILFFNLIIAFSLAAGELSPKLPVLIVFHSPSCHKCIQAKKELLPKIEKKFRQRIRIEYRDTNDIENYKLLLSLKDKYAPEESLILPVFFFEGQFINAEVPLGNRVELMIERNLSKSHRERPALAPIDLITYFKNFKPLAVISAGLIDGVNPCAFTVLVFFISFLSLQGYRKRELIAIGLVFIFSVFITYLFIGLGLFGFLYRLSGFWLAAKIFNFSIGILSIALGFLALYDFFKFSSTQQTEGLILQLPNAVKSRIHSIIGLHYRKQNSRPLSKLVLGTFITGFLVSILEAVCTGQVYLPTITFVLKTTTLKLQALGYLLLYNFMFIIPLLLIFLFALLGVTSEQFARILKKHLGTIKILMALLFFGLGIFLIWRP